MKTRQFNSKMTGLIGKITLNGDTTMRRKYILQTVAGIILSLWKESYFSNMAVKNILAEPRSKVTL